MVAVLVADLAINCCANQIAIPSCSGECIISAVAIARNVSDMQRRLSWFISMAIDICDLYDNLLEGSMS